jgi:hypothetical protein
MWHLMEIKELLHLKYPCDWVLAIKLPHINFRNVVGLQTKVGVSPFLIHLPCVLIMNFMGCIFTFRCAATALLWVRSLPPGPSLSSARRAELLFKIPYQYFSAPTRCFSNALPLLYQEIRTDLFTNPAVTDSVLTIF